MGSYWVNYSKISGAIKCFHGRFVTKCLSSSFKSSKIYLFSWNKTLTCGNSYLPGKQFRYNKKLSLAVLRCARRKKNAFIPILKQFISSKKWIFVLLLAPLSQLSSIPQPAYYGKSNLQTLLTSYISTCLDHNLMRKTICDLSEYLNLCCCCQWAHFLGTYW